MSQKAKREQYVVFANTATDGTAKWEAIGKDNEDLSRTLNNNVNSFKNVLGVTEVDVTKGAQTTTVDPFKLDDSSDLSKILEAIYWEDKDGSDVEIEFLEVMLKDADNADNYKAFKQTGAISLSSIGGDTTGISTPFDINWKGERVYGTFNPATKTFTPNESA